MREEAITLPAKEPREQVSREEEQGPGEAGTMWRESWLYGRKFCKTRPWALGSLDALNFLLGQGDLPA